MSKFNVTFRDTTAMAHTSLSDIKNQEVDMHFRDARYPIEKIATREQLGMIIVGDNLLVTEDGVLSVDTADVAEPNNTKPITSQGRAQAVGTFERITNLEIDALFK